MINKTVLIGRLVKDPDTRVTNNGTVVSAFTLAVERTFKSSNGEKDTDFIPIVVWGKTAKLCDQYLAKGSMTGVSGRIQTRSYEAQDGTRRYVTEVVADEIMFLTFRKEQTADNEFGVPMDGFNEMDDDDEMPF